MMTKLHFAALLLALPAPLLAQTTEPTDAGASASAAQSSSQPAPTAGQKQSLAMTIANEFPTYDTDKSGELSQSEFSTWMTAAKMQSGGTAPDKAWLDSAYAKADTDKNTLISAAELEAYLTK